MPDEQTPAAIWARITAFVEAFPQWAENHPAISSWVGVVAPVLAVFLVWMLTRIEYRRDRRSERIWINNEIDLIIQILNGFEDLHSRYVDTLLSSDAGTASEFRKQHANAAAVHGLRDLANLPAAQWPNFESYVLFKEYFTRSIEPFDPSDDQDQINRLSTKQLVEHEANFTKLKAVLEKAKR